MDEEVVSIAVTGAMKIATDSLDNTCGALDEQELVASNGGGDDTGMDSAVEGIAITVQGP